MTFNTSAGAHASPKFVVGLDIAIVSLCAVVAIAFVGLIFIGSWQDEYFTVAHIRDDGIPFVTMRLLAWSFRPLSELFVYLYSVAVIDFDSALIGPGLAPCWALFFIAVMLPSIHAGRGVVVSAVLGCLLLVGHKVAEVFYWPIGALAYMPTLSALVVLFSLDVAGLSETTAGRAWAVTALLVAATCSEVGALFTLCYCGLAGLAAPVTRDRKLAWLLLPMCAALVVLYYMLSGRVAQNMERVGDPSIIHHPVPALMAALRSFGLQVIGSDAPAQSARALLVGAASKLLFFCGAYLSISGWSGTPSARLQTMRLVLASALVGSAFLMLTAAYYQFGLDCCERHGTMRQAHIFIALGTLALLFATWKPVQRPSLGRVCLLLALIIPLATTVPGLRSDYRHYRQFVEAEIKTWQSGRADGSVMTVTQATPGKIVGGTLVSAGTIDAKAPNQDVIAQRILDYFKKQTGRFEPPLNGH